MIGSISEARRSRPPCHVTHNRPPNVRLRGPRPARTPPYASTPRVACHRAPPRSWTRPSLCRVSDRLHSHDVTSLPSAWTQARLESGGAFLRTYRLSVRERVPRRRQTRIGHGADGGDAMDLGRPVVEDRHGVLVHADRPNLGVLCQGSRQSSRAPKSFHLGWAAIDGHYVYVELVSLPANAVEMESLDNPSHAPAVRTSFRHEIEVQGVGGSRAVGLRGRVPQDPRTRGAARLLRRASPLLPRLDVLRRSSAAFQLAGGRWRALRPHPRGQCRRLSRGRHDEHPPREWRSIPGTLPERSAQDSHARMRTTDEPACSGNRGSRGGPPSCFAVTDVQSRSTKSTATSLTRSIERRSN